MTIGNAQQEQPINAMEEIQATDSIDTELQASSEEENIEVSEEPNLPVEIVSEKSVELVDPWVRRLIHNLSLQINERAEITDENAIKEYRSRYSTGKLIEMGKMTIQEQVMLENGDLAPMVIEYSKIAKHNVDTIYLTIPETPENKYSKIVIHLGKEKDNSIPQLPKKEYKEKVPTKEVKIDKPVKQVPVVQDNNPPPVYMSVTDRIREALSNCKMDLLLVKYTTNWILSHQNLVREFVNPRFTETFALIYPHLKGLLEKDYDTVFSKLVKLNDSVNKDFLNKIKFHKDQPEVLFIDRESMVLSFVDPDIGEFVKYLNALTKSMPKFTYVMRCIVDIFSEPASKIVITTAQPDISVLKAVLKAAEVKVAPEPIIHFKKPVDVLAVAPEVLPDEVLDAVINGNR